MTGNSIARFTLRRNWTAGAAVAAAAAALVVVPGTPARAVDPDILNAVTGLAQRYLAARAGQLTSSGVAARVVPGPDVSMSVDMAERTSAVDTQLQGERRQLAAAGVVYGTSRVDLEEPAVQVAGDTATLEVRETTELAPPAGSQEPVTAQSVDRVFQFRRSGATWQLVSQQPVAVEGMAPITEPGRDGTAVAVDNSGPIGDDPAENGGSVNPVDRREDETWQDPTVVESDAAGAAPVPDKDVPDEPAPSTPAPAPTTSVPGTPAPGPTFTVQPCKNCPTIGHPVRAPEALKAPNARAIPRGMCYTCMRDYAYAHWKNYHPGYRSWANSNRGGDCTNFLSQIMRRGGWRDDLGWYRSNSNWWYTSSHQTYTWAGAENWSKFAPKRTNRLDNVWKLGFADVLQMDFNRDGTMDHSMVVTKVTSRDVYLTYHSTNTKDRSLKSILRSYPRAWYYAYRT